MLWLVLAASNAGAQQLAPTPSASPGATLSDGVSQPAVDEEIVPTFETQKLARTYILDIPAPRGQITDRNGAPMEMHPRPVDVEVKRPIGESYGPRDSQLDKAVEVLLAQIKGS